MPNQGFMQMFQLMLQMAGQRQQQAVAEREVGVKEKQLDELVKQWEVTHKDKDISDAIKTMATMSQEGRQAFLTLQKHLAPEEVEALRRVATAEPISPDVLGMQDTNVGFANRSPQDAAMAQREAAMRASTGMNVGQAGGSQLMGAMATGAPPPGQLASVIPREAWGTLVQNFAARTAQGYTPEQMGIQQGNLKLGTLQLDLEERKLLAEVGLKKLAEEGKGGVTAATTGELMIGIGKIIDQMNAPSSDKAGNFGRQRLIGKLSQMLGFPTDYFVQQPAGAAGLPTPAGPFRQYIQGQPGFTPGVVPGLGGPMSGVPRF